VQGAYQSVEREAACNCPAGEKWFGEQLRAKVEQELAAGKFAGSPTSSPAGVLSCAQCGGKGVFTPPRRYIGDRPTAVPCGACSAGAEQASQLADLLEARAASLDQAPKD